MWLIREEGAICYGGGDGRVSGYFLNFGLEAGKGGENEYADKTWIHT